MSATFKRPAPATRMADGFDLDSALLRLSGVDALSWRELLGGGALVMGDSGSGKTSGPVTSLGVAAYRANASVVHNTVKPTDCAMWAGLARCAGRGVVSYVIGRDTFNPLAFEQSRGDGTRRIETLTQLVLLPLRRQSRGGGGDPFWQADGARYVRHLVTMFVIAGVPLSYKRIADSLNSLPTSVEETRDPEWRRRCPAFGAAQRASELLLSPRDRADLEDAVGWLLHQCPATPERTRASTVATVVSALDPLLRGEIGATLNSDADTWTPASIVAQPGVLVLDCPLQVWGETGAIVQRMLISAIQRETLRRQINTTTKPLVLILDEYQEILDAEDDPSFIRTARDRLGCCVLATQGIGGIRAACGHARDPRAAAESILGLPGVKLFAATTDPETLQYASAVFANTPQTRVSFGTSTPGADKNGRERSSRNSNVTRELQPEVPPFELTRLKRGGPEHDHLVEAFCSVSGRVWRGNNRTSIKVAFRQRR